MAYAIQDKNGDHLGFLLTVGEGESGGCIFRSLPAKSELLHTPESELLYEYQGLGEFKWVATIDGLEISHPENGKKAEVDRGELRIGEYVFKIIETKAS